MDLSKIKRIKELTSINEVNKYLENGWQIITTYQLEISKPVHFVLGTTSSGDIVSWVKDAEEVKPIIFAKGNTNYKGSEK